MQFFLLYGSENKVESALYFFNVEDRCDTMKLKKED